MKDQLNISDKSKISMPIANLLMVVGLVASTVFGYTALTNRITALETQDQLMSSDLLKKAEQTPKNLEIFLLIEHNATQINKHQKLLDENIHSRSAKLRYVIKKKDFFDFETDIFEKFNHLIKIEDIGNKL